MWRRWKASSRRWGICRDPRRPTKRKFASGSARRKSSSGGLSGLLDSSAEAREAIQASLAEINGRAGEPRSFDRLERLLESEAYRLSFWRVAMDEINYRRFFDINDLAAIRVEDPEVFSAVHALIFDLVRRGTFAGCAWIIRTDCSSLRNISAFCRMPAKPGARPAGMASDGRRQSQLLYRCRENPERQRAAADRMGRRRHHRLRFSQPW